MTKAIILLSGGLDSVVSLAYSKDFYSDILSLTFDYSQKSSLREIEAAKKISQYYSIKNEVIKLDWLGDISNSSLNNKKNIPNLSENELNNIEITKNSAKSVWVPNRNALFVNIAASFAESLGFDDIIIGANEEEGKTFIDNSAEFINAINNSLKYSLNRKITVKAPLINMTKENIVQKGIQLNIPFNLIYSCYNGEKRHCAKCESCVRLKKSLKTFGRIDIIDSIFGGKL